MLIYRNNLRLEIREIILIHRKRLLTTGGLADLDSWLTQYGLKKFDVTVLTREKGDVTIQGNY